MAKSSPKLLCIADYARHAGVAPQTIAAMIRRGQIRVARTKGRQKLLNVVAADKAREENRLRARSAPTGGTVLAAQIARLRSELALRRERLARDRASLTPTASTTEGARAMIEELAPRIALNDTLVDRIMTAGGDAARVRGVLTAWTRESLGAAVSALEARAASMAGATGDAPAAAPVAEEPTTIVGFRAAIAEIEAEQAILRLACLRGEVVGRDQSLSAAEDLGRRGRVRFEQLGNMSAELADAIQGGRAAVCTKLGAVMTDIAGGLRGVIGPVAGDAAAPC